MFDKPLEISIFNGTNIKLAPLKEIATLYCDVWREPPWNESFWVVEDVVNDILEEMQKNDAHIIVASYGNSVIGFSWGYTVSQKDMRQIIGNKSLDYLFEDNSKVAYIDELATTSVSRCKGIGKTLSESLVQELSNCGVTKITLRTDEKAMPARHLYNALTFNELAARDFEHKTRTYWLLVL